VRKQTQHPTRQQGRRGKSSGRSGKKADMVLTARQVRKKIRRPTLQEVADSSQLVQFHCHSLFGVYYL
jgi:hypothetical protein